MHDDSTSTKISIHKRLTCSKVFGITNIAYWGSHEIQDGEIAFSKKLQRFSRIPSKVIELFANLERDCFFLARINRDVPFFGKNTKI